MKPTINSDEYIEKHENDFYAKFLEKAIDFADGKKTIDGLKFRQLVAAAGVVAKQKQTRSAMNALRYAIERDSARGLFNDEARPLLNAGTKK